MLKSFNFPFINSNTFIINNKDEIFTTTNTNLIQIAVDIVII